MYFCMNLKMKKPMLHCCFTWIVFIELNFTVRFACKVGEWGILINGGILVMGYSKTYEQKKYEGVFCQCHAKRFSLNGL